MKRLLSLFSGGGGMDIGFEGGFQCLRRSINTTLHPDWITEEDDDWVTLKKTGFHTVFANDIRLPAKTSWVSYFSKYMSNAEQIYHLDSIVDLVKLAKAGEHIFPDNIDVVTGGFPCQDFSIAGKRNGFHSHKSHNGGLLSVDEPSTESRGQLYMWMRDVVTITKPLLFVAENVKGLTNLDDVKEVIERDFANAADGGYLVIPAKVLHAADYGVPQSRERVIFFGFKKSALTEQAKKPYPPRSSPQSMTLIQSQHTPITYLGAPVCISLSPARKPLLVYRSRSCPRTYLNRNTQKQSIWVGIARDRQKFDWIPLARLFGRSIMATLNTAV